MLDRSEPVVDFKLAVLAKALPDCDSAVLFGDMWRVDGGYSIECAQHCERVLLIDSLETAAWQQARIAEPKIDFRKGDFSDPLFMAGIRDKFDLGVVYDILLHQPAMLGTLTLMLGLVEKRFCVVQPMLEEQAHPGTLIYLPGNPSVKDLYPLDAEASDHKLFDVDQVNHSHWIWAMTPSFLTAAIAAEGFDLVFEQTLGPLPNPRWQWWGGVYERRRPQSPGHWSKQQVTPGIFAGEW
ncbi:MAG TPA: hypothetical protein VGW80_09155 [Solirubrobacterales bacterium]|jgi:hypothetical protein|nr:hypothetical protein [Solirubrobacterales bacterium]